MCSFGIVVEAPETYQTCGVSTAHEEQCRNRTQTPAPILESTAILDHYESTRCHGRKTARS